MSEWRARPSKGGVIGVAFTVVAALCGAAALLYLIGRPIAIDSFVAAVVGIAGLLLAALIGILTFGYYSLRYRLSETDLTISWLWTEERIPLAGVEGLYKGRWLGNRAEVEGIAWPGYYAGRARAEELGRAKFYGTTTDPERALVIGTQDNAYALTPADLDGFRESMIARLNAVPEQEAGDFLSPETVMPRLLRLSLLRDGVALGILALSFLAMLAAFGYVSARIPYLPELMPLHFNFANQPDVVGPPRDAFRMPLIGAVAMMVNLVVAAVVHGRQPKAGRVLAGATLFVQIVVLMAILRVVH